MEMFSLPADRKGVTLVELIIVMVILSVLASIAMPMYRLSVKRAKEYELRQDLREMRNAIDEYRRWVDNGWVNKITDSGYPPTLDVLVDGVPVANRAVGAGQTKWNPPGQLPEKMKFLRRIPVDPMTGKAEWELKSNADVATGSSFSGGGDVFDVRSKSDGEALDGTNYSDW